MSELKITPGPCEVHNGKDVFGPLGGDSGDGTPADSNDGWMIADCSGSACVDGEITQLSATIEHNNAQFIADAFNVANATGLTPRQLLEQRDALADAVEEMRGRFALSSATLAALAKIRGQQ